MHAILELGVEMSGVAVQPVNRLGSVNSVNMGSRREE
jgi:hypothetical protein